MRIVMSGASGMIGTALSKLLESRGDEVIRLVRRPAANNKEWSWDPSAGVLDEAVLDGADAVVNLSGAGIGDRPWTKNRIRVLHESRLQPTRTLTAAMGRLGSPPRAFVSQSASGYYGASRREVLHEDSAPGEGGVLAPLCVQWEEAARTAPDGVRVVTPRTGVVLSTQGGALGPLLPLLKVGLGGPFGNGRQYWPWITLADEASALAFLVDSQLEGAVNLCAPGLADVNTIVARLAEGFYRPAFLRVPRPALRLVLGGLADELVMADQAMYPGKLAGAGFTWQHPELRQAVAWLTSRPGR
ncbi:TIGR01777 family oxidoreductase [Paenarthrobacter ureafaciens]|uniref:TIGR01777 family oxidoreductase n=1 Tax=Paenarthrobacter ureafaciens TaxID=37931 RepID=UPI001409E0E9|nr:TIGR01777 family oxidoreductase [Paenarthrobacter ureafaciens]MCX8455324.1 TIGR01777 family oxidoreductase [Paenarthrobacter ureafaciens]MCY0974051.1 TIGR01777 family oxidoreductase [Paenarthrobacter ureafaciens]